MPEMKQPFVDALAEFFPGASEHDSRTIADLFDLADLVDDIERRIRELAEDSGMPSLHFFLLEHLALNGGAASIGEILSALNLPKQSATYIIDRLEADGFVERRRDERDRRRFEVALTRDGRRQVKSSLGPFYGAMFCAMESVSNNDRVVLLRALKGFRNALRAAPVTDDAEE